MECNNKLKHLQNSDLLFADNWVTGLCQFLRSDDKFINLHICGCIVIFFNFLFMNKKTLASFLNLNQEYDKVVMTK